MKVDFDFEEKYLCLKRNLFKTIRGVSRIKKFEINDIVELGYKGEYLLDGIILKIERTQLHYLSVDELADILDTADDKIKSVEDAIRAINKYRPFNKINCEDDYVSVFTIQRKEAKYKSLYDEIKEKLGE